MVRNKQNLGAISVFLIGVIGGGTAIGVLTAPGEWYADLTKPEFNPPNWIFGPVWSVLYLFVAIAGWRVWRIDRSGAAMKAWYVQLALNFAWSPVFFVAHRIDLALVIILLLLAAILVFMINVWRSDRLSALLIAPYAAWVAFATVLNASLILLNPAAVA